MSFTVAIYLTDRAYGGPEEGGWWYDCGDRQNDRPQYNVRMIEKAREVADRLNAELRADNAGRPSVSSVLSIGRYRALVFEGPAPAYYPETRPYYE